MKQVADPFESSPPLDSLLRLGEDMLAVVDPGKAVMGRRDKSKDFIEVQEWLIWEQLRKTKDCLLTPLQQEKINNWISYYYTHFYDAKKKKKKDIDMELSVMAYVILIYLMNFLEGDRKVPVLKIKNFFSELKTEDGFTYEINELLSKGYAVVQKEPSKYRPQDKILLQLQIKGYQHIREEYQKIEEGKEDNENFYKARNIYNKIIQQRFGKKENSD